MEELVRDDVEGKEVWGDFVKRIGVKEREVAARERSWSASSAC